MARDENPPFARGATWYDGTTIDTNDLGGVNLEGAEWVFEDVHPTTGVRRTERPVRCRVVRNTSGVNLLPKLVVKFEEDGLEYGSRVNGYAIASAANTPEEGYPVDEYLPAAGVPTNDLFWIVIEGPATVTSSIAVAATDTVVGEWQVAVTAAATNVSTTAGRVIPQFLAGTAATMVANIQNRIGRAMTARLTSATATDCVIDVGKW